MKWGYSLFPSVIIIIKDDIKTSIDENGLITMEIFDFLLNEDYLEI